jgi:uncharacterized membrane protein (DUF106 family)
MFGIFKANPLKKLQKQHAQLQEQAMMAQRNGDMRKFASLTSEAEKIYSEIQALEKSQ